MSLASEIGAREAAPREVRLASWRHVSFRPAKSFVRFSKGMDSLVVFRYSLAPE